jgi:HSP20 family protein
VAEINVAKSVQRENAPRTAQGTTQIEKTEPAFRGLATGLGHPFHVMRRMMNEMNHYMDRFFDFGAYPSTELDLWRDFPRGLWQPQIDVREKDGKLLVKADLPGLKAEDLDVRVENEVLTIAGERRDEYEGEEKGVRRAERSYGRFERRIALPSGVDFDAIDAKFDDGVLEIAVALPMERGGRRIDVKSGGGAAIPAKPKATQH